MNKFLATCLLSLAVLGQTVGAQNNACNSPEHHRFDFWLGEWQVFDYSGGKQGPEIATSKIVSIMNGCGLQENWLPFRGSKGTSYNAYSKTDQRWYQTWVDEVGTVLLLAGGFKDGQMVLLDAQQHNRISWGLVNGDPNRVRQLWESTADGKTWKVEFDGLYVRKP